MGKLQTIVTVHGVTTAYPLREFDRHCRTWEGLTAARGARNPFTVIYRHHSMHILSCAKHPERECAVIEMGRV